MEEDRKDSDHKPIQAPDDEDVILASSDNEDDLEDDQRSGN